MYLNQTMAQPKVLELGASPDATRIAGHVHADANHEHNNATTTFWRAAEGLSIKPAGGTMQWAVSQAVSLRRMYVRGDPALLGADGTVIRTYWELRFYWTASPTS
jgi:hypothetical protein